MSDNTTPPPPPGGGTPGWENPGGYGGDQGGYGGGGYGPGAYGAGPAGAEHPEGQKLLIVSIVALICGAPVNIWVLVKANGIIASPGGYNISKVSTARIIAIVSLVLWALGIVVNLFTGTLGALTGQV
jgi:hypothetical protein